MNLTTSCVSSDKLRIDMRDGMLRAALSGIVGLRECMGALGRVRAAVHATSAPAVLVDMRSAAVTLSPPDYVRLVQAVLERPIRLPVAFVVSQGLTLIADAHALVMARRGLRQRIFSEPRPAVRWLARQVRMRPAPDLLG